MTRRLDEILNEINEDILENDNLIEKGIISSIDVIAIVSEIEVELGVEIAPEDIKTANFTSYETIKKLFSKYEKRS